MAAFERAILTDDRNESWGQSAFIVWGAGRDGKDFVKALSSLALRQRVYCMMDVDDQKIERGFYVCNGGGGASSQGRVQKNEGWNIPIVHFSLADRKSVV